MQESVERAPVSVKKSVDVSVYISRDYVSVPDDSEMIELGRNFFRLPSSNI